MKKKGFTLIELIVVIAIIGVLAAILVPAMLGYIKKSKITNCNSAAKSIMTAATSAVTDIDAEDRTNFSITAITDVSDEVGTAFDAANPTANVQGRFYKKIATYFSDIDSLEGVSIDLDNGVPVAVAVQDSRYFGTNPSQLSVDDYDANVATNTTSSAWLTYAAG